MPVDDGHRRGGERDPVGGRQAHEGEGARRDEEDGEGNLRVRERAVGAERGQRHPAEDDEDDAEKPGRAHRVQYTPWMRLCPFVLAALLLAPACNDADDDIRANVTLLCNHEGALATAAADT